MHMTPISRHEHYLEMRELVRDGAPYFTALDCLGIAYGPGCGQRRRAWERQTTRSFTWNVYEGVEVVIEAKHLPERE